jgi:hypothetical protein
MLSAVRKGMFHPEKKLKGLMHLVASYIVTLKAKASVQSSAKAFTLGPPSLEYGVQSQAIIRENGVFSLVPWEKNHNCRRLS